MKEYVSKMTKGAEAAPLPGSEEAIKVVPVREEPAGGEQPAVESKVSLPVIKRHVCPNRIERVSATDIEFID